MKEEIKESYIGVGNAGRTPLFEKGVEYTPFGLKPAELSFREGRVLTKEEILNVFGINLSLVSEKSTRANADNALVQYARSTVKPRLTRIEQKLNEKFTPRWGNNNMFLSFDNPVPEDILIGSKVRAESIRTGQITINEARSQLRMPPIKGGDEPLFQQQYMPLSSILAGENLKPTNQTNPSNQPTSSNQNNNGKSVDDVAEELLPLVVRRVQEKTRQKSNS